MTAQTRSTDPSTSSVTRSIRVAVLGNPNTGKSTLFNRLTGIRQQTANYPRVTIEHHIGNLQHEQVQVELIDLPGTYSLTPRSPEEVITVNVLLGIAPASAPPDVILCVVDASNLERNLFLVSQILDLHQPTVIAVNMIDVAKSQGQEIDVARLSRRLGIPTVCVQANKGLGLQELKSSILQVAAQKPATFHDPFPEDWQQRINSLISSAAPVCTRLQNFDSTRFTVIRTLFDTDGFMTKCDHGGIGPKLIERIQQEQAELEVAGIKIAEVESQLRYAWISKHIRPLVRQEQINPITTTDRVDRWLTHPLWGLLFVSIVMIAVFQAVFKIAEPASAAIDYFSITMSGIVNSILPDGALNSLVNDGLINGVGGVLIFLPQIVLLFFILAVLEDSGYLARAAFLLDRYLSKLGLSGITLFPLLSSFACAIPGIMATRVIPDHKERMITMLIAPLMSCSARLPVYVLMISAFVPKTSVLGGWLGLQGMVMLAMYLVGIVVAIAMAWILKRTFFKMKSSSFVMELPTYKIPSLNNILHRMFDGGWAFVQGAGTIIVAVTILVWVACYFPRANELPADLLARRAILTTTLAELEGLGDNVAPEIMEERDELTAQIDGLDAGYQLRQSYLGRAGLAIEPIVKPLGWDWRIGSAAIASFPAREVVVATMGVLFGMGDDLDEESSLLREGLMRATWDGTDKKLFTLPVALSIMVFFALCAQCASTLAVMRRETKSWFWPGFAFTYMTILAYIGAFLTFQISNSIIG